MVDPQNKLRSAPTMKISWVCSWMQWSLDLTLERILINKLLVLSLRDKRPRKHVTSSLFTRVFFPYRKDVLLSCQKEQKCWIQAYKQDYIFDYPTMSFSKNLWPKKYKTKPRDTEQMSFLDLASILRLWSSLCCICC